MKRSIIILGVMAAVCLMVSSVTAVPQVKGTQIADILEKGETIEISNIKVTKPRGRLLEFLQKLLNWYNDHNIEEWLNKWQGRFETLDIILNKLFDFERLNDLEEFLGAILTIIEYVFGGNGTEDQ